MTLSETVDWSVGASILVTTSSYIAHEAERLTIANISADGKTITTEESLQYDHTSTKHNFNGYDEITLAAEVGLLSRRIKIVGAPFPGLFFTSFII